MFSHFSKIYLPPELVKRRQELVNKTNNKGNNREFVEKYHRPYRNFYITFDSGKMETPCYGPMTGHKVF